MATNFQEVHKPSRAQALTFFFICLALAVGVIVWTFWLNRGTLIVEGPAPFGVEAGAENKECTASPCVLKVKPHAYTITLKKDGYYDDDQQVEVRRFKETAVKANLQYIPKVMEAGEIILPISETPLRPPFLGLARFENFPKDIKAAQFSASGNQILVTLGREIYIYDVAKKILSATNLSPDFYPAWAGEDVLFLVKVELKQALKKWNGGKIETIVVFDRPFVNPQIFGSPSGKKAVISEKTDGDFSYYLVDLEKKSRQRLAVSRSAQLIKWTLDDLIFEEPEEKGKKVFALNANTLEQKTLGATSGSNVLETAPGNFVFLSSEKQDSKSTQLGPSISEVLEKAVEETTSAPKAVVESSVFLVEFSSATGELKTLAEVPLKQNEKVEHLTADLNGKKYYFEKSGKLFEVRLEPQ
ncbi:MAG: hypothetical protein AAB588_05845 [Patescibacteria group bacterium]